MKFGKNFPLLLNICGIFLVALTILSCNKSGSKVPTPSYPSGIKITGLSPNEGPYNCAVTIYGSGFNASLDLDTVLFNGKMAIIGNASDSQLLVMVPYLAGTGPIVVKTGIYTKTGFVFTYDY